MALANIGDLKAFIIAWSDIEADQNRLDEIITLAEDEMFTSGENTIRVKEMQTDTTLSTNTSDRFVSLPSDYLEPRRLQIVVSDNYSDLHYRVPSGLSLFQDADQGVPSEFTVNSRIELNRVSDQVYSLIYDYYARPAALTAANPTNTILTNYPSVYAYSCVAAAKSYQGELEEAATWINKATSVIANINTNDSIGQYGPGLSESVAQEDIP